MAEKYASDKINSFRKRLAQLTRTLQIKKKMFIKILSITK